MEHLQTYEFQIGKIRRLLLINIGHIAGRKLSTVIRSFLLFDLGTLIELPIFFLGNIIITGQSIDRYGDLVPRY